MTIQRRTARRPGPVGLARAQRRLTAWDDQLVTSLSVTSGAENSFLLTENVSDTEKRGCTIVRIILALELLPSVPGNVSGVQTVSMGIGATSDDAFAAGALPNAEVDTDFPVMGWLWRGKYLVRDETLATGIVPFPRIDADLRSQRKIDRSSVFVILQNTPVQGTAFNILVSGMVRVLYKLP